MEVAGPLVVRRGKGVRGGWGGAVVWYGVLVYRLHRECGEDRIVVRERVALDGFPLVKDPGGSNVYHGVIR